MDLYYKGGAWIYREEQVQDGTTNAPKKVCGWDFEVVWNGAL